MFHPVHNIIVGEQERCGSVELFNRANRGDDGLDIEAEGCAKDTLVW